VNGWATVLRIGYPIIIIVIITVVAARIAGSSSPIPGAVAVSLRRIVHQSTPAGTSTVVADIANSIAGAETLVRIVVYLKGIRSQRAVVIAQTEIVTAA
jgi:hypothetical protein